MAGDLPRSCLFLNCCLLCRLVVRFLSSSFFEAHLETKCIAGRRRRDKYGDVFQLVIPHSVFMTGIPKGETRTEYKMRKSQVRGLKA